MSERRYPRFYGGHYDSIKQGIIRDTAMGDPLSPNPLWSRAYCNYYTARLRIDLLLSGNIILTDSQFYDGALMHHLVYGSESQDFMKFLNRVSEEKHPILEVRRRSGGLLQMLNKPFFFSALPEERMRFEVMRAMETVLNRRQEPFGSIQDAFGEYEAAIENTDTMTEFIKLKEVVKRLDTLPENLFRPWSSSMTAGQLMTLAKAKLGFGIPTTDIDELNVVLVQIEDEMRKEWPNRSRIRESIREGIELSESEPKESEIVAKVWADVCQVYNLAFAFQHDCNCLDVGEASVSLPDTTHLATSRENKAAIDSLIGSLSPEIIMAIAEEPWIEFLLRISTEPLYSAWQSWRESVASLTSEQTGLRRLASLLPPLDNLVGKVRLSYGRAGDDKGFWRALYLVISGTGGLLLGGGSSETILATAGLLLGTAAVTIGATNLIQYGIGLQPTDHINLIRLGLRIEKA